MSELRCPTAALLAVGLLVVVGCGKPAAPPAPPPPRDLSVPVTLRAVEVATVPRAIEAVGTLWGSEDAIISVKIPGRVVAVAKDTGDGVEPGEELMRLDASDYTLDRAHKEAALAESLAKLGVAALPPDDADVAAFVQAQKARLPAVMRAQHQLNHAAQKLQRAKDLAERRPPVISQQELEDAKTEHEVAKSTLELEHRTVELNLREARTRSAALAIATRTIEDAVVRAPATAPGARPTPYRVAQRMAAVGEYKSPASPAFRLVALDPLKLRLAVSEIHFARVRVGQPVDVRLEAYGDRRFEGKVSRIGPQVDPANRTFQVEAELTNPRSNESNEYLLSPGAFAKATIRTGVDDGVVFVPLEAVVSFAGIDKAFTVRDGVAVEHVLSLGARRGDLVEVRKGLESGQLVVVSGTTKLARDVKVTITSAGSQTNPATPEPAGSLGSSVATPR